MYTHVFPFHSGLDYTRGAHVSFPLHCRWLVRIERWDGMGWMDGSLGLNIFILLLEERENGSGLEQGGKKAIRITW